MNINLSDIAKGMPGITPAVGAMLAECGYVMMHRSGHASPTELSISGIVDRKDYIAWQDNCSEQMIRAHADIQELTELSAVGVSLALTKPLTGFTIIERSRKGTGFDYSLGNDDEMFIPQARLEISGIEKESLTNTVENRFNQKASQVKVSDDTNLPAFVSIVEFSTPKVLFNKIQSEKA